jgi:Nucleotidyltransferase of unknown function (DUF6036)
LPPITQTIDSPLWALALGGQPIDATSLANAVESELAHPEENLDFRTRLLIRDSLTALAHHWGEEKLNRWRNRLSHADILNRVLSADLGEAGFPSLTRRIMDTTKPETVLQFLRELGMSCPQPTRLEIGGAIAAILAGILSRHTEDIDVVDEIPVVIRSQHDKLHELADRFGVRLTHFQSHFLPSGWRNRLQHFDQFGDLEILLVDAIDLFVGKLFSARTKDRDDLRAMARHLDKTAIENRLRDSAGSLIAEPRLKQFATDNWFIIYGQPLPA